ncbi:MAG TPA: TonB-dependent receptor, partial [Chitinophagaceae bacterium]|nr:TonB-dependent receptor [Chitinophagaceae bacterium]
KGSASTLYGGGAIAGLINLVSKTPEKERELTFLLNTTTVKGVDASIFYSQRFKKVGTTVLASYNFNAPYDPANIGLTAIPKITRFTLSPKIFFYPNEKTKGYFGINTAYENRYGGDIKVIEGKADSTHQYFENNITLRTSTQFNIEHKINDKSKIQFKNSIGFFDRNLSQPNTNFHGQQVSTFTEFNYSNNKEKSEWVTGVNIWTDNLKSLNISNFDYHLATFGAFAQNIFKATDWFSLESGLRIDYNTPSTNNRLKGFFILPRVNALFKIGEHFTSRIGGGLGYKMPSPFSEEAEQKGYQNILPIDINKTKAEQSYGSNADINFITHLDEVSLSINQLFFYTYINNPLVLQGNSFMNANGYIDTKGTETNVNIGWQGLHLFFGYTFADALQHFDAQNFWQPLTAKHRLLTDFTYEKENNYRTGIECNYISAQRLSDGTIGKGYFTVGLFVEKTWKNLSIFINAENLTDQRQTRWDTIYTGTITNPIFKDIYAPTDGIVINAGVKIKL